MEHFHMVSNRWQGRTGAPFTLLWLKLPPKRSPHLREILKLARPGTVNQPAWSTLLGVWPIKPTRLISFEPTCSSKQSETYISTGYPLDIHCISTCHPYVLLGKFHHPLGNAPGVHLLHHGVLFHYVQHPSGAKWVSRRGTGMSWWRTMQQLSLL